MDAMRGKSDEEKSFFKAFWEITWRETFGRKFCLFQMTVLFGDSDPITAGRGR